MNSNFTGPGLRSRYDGAWSGIPSALRSAAPAGGTFGATAGALGGAAGAAWSTTQIVVAVIAVSALLVAAPALIVSSLTTFNLNNYYYGRIGELGAAVLDPAGPLYVDAAADTVTLTCAASSTSLCPYFAYVNDSIADFEAFMNNGTTPNVTLSTLGYTNAASFMANVTNGKDALDNLVGEANVLQAQIDVQTAQIAALLAANGTTTLSTLGYTNAAPFMYNVTNGKAALDNLVGEDIVQNDQIVALQAQTAQLLATTSRTIYVSATYGSDVTGDGSHSLPVASLYRAMQLVPNTTSEFSQYTIAFDNGLYSESNYIAFKPNVILSGNEVGTLLIFAAGAGLDGGAWIATGTGYVSFLRLGLIRCTAACAFDMSTAAPSTSIFSVFRFYNSTLDLNTGALSFRRRADTTSYFGVTMESVTAAGTSVTFADMTIVNWDLSGDTYSAIAATYNSSSTYASGIPVVNVNGLVAHGNVAVSNYVSGLTVDVSLMDVIMRDSATLSRTAVSGAFVNAHGDVLSLGAINGGLTTSGGGSTEYLTKAPGLGYTPTTVGDWPSVPTTQQQADDYLAGRVTALESTPQRRFVLQFAGNTTTNFALPANITTVYFSGCGGGSSGAGSTPGNGYGGNAGAGLLDFPVPNEGATFSVFVGAGGALGAVSADGQSSTISNGVITITLEGGKSTAGANRGGNVIFSGDTIVAGAAGAGTPGNPAVFNGFAYGGAGGGVSNVGGLSEPGGYVPLRQPRSSAANSGNANGGGGGSSIFGIGGAGAPGTVPTDGFPGGLCAGGGGGGSDLVTASNGGAGGNGMIFAYYYIA